MMIPHRTGRRSAFTLVELLTVVGIIALLIGILMPTLASARRQSKIAKSKSTIKTINDSLEAFRNDFDEYPDSSVQYVNRVSAPKLVQRADPIRDFPGAPSGAKEVLSGAHWLARALGGVDYQGIDSSGFALRPRNEVAFDGQPVVVSDNGTGVTMDQYLERYGRERKNAYISDSKFYLRDSDTRFNQVGSPRTGRPVFIDAFSYPIIYYRANPKARRPFSKTITVADSGGVYRWEDNAAITGINGPKSGNPLEPDDTAWQFAAGTPNHVLGNFGPEPYTTNDFDQPGSFISFFHDHSVHEISGGLNVKPYMPDTYILATPGPDGRFGTDDDITNFKQ